MGTVEYILKKEYARVNNLDLTWQYNKLSSASGLTGLTLIRESCDQWAWKKEWMGVWFISMGIYTPHPLKKRNCGIDDVDEMF